MRVNVLTSKKESQKKIKKFEILYDILDDLGTDHKSGEYENDFAKLRAGLINGIPNGYSLDILEEALKSDKIEIDIDYDNLIAVLTNEMSSDKELELAISDYVSGKTKKYELLLAILKNALKNGISDQELRPPISDYVSGKTKKYELLYAVLEIVDFTLEKEFSVIYGNFARQPINSKDKRQNLSDLRDAAVRKMINQTTRAIDLLSAKKTEVSSEQSGLMEEKKRQIDKLWNIFQNNLLFITSYEMSEYIFGEILKILDFHKENFFKIFYKNLRNMNNTEEQRWRVIEQVKLDQNKDFVKGALSIAFANEISEKIMEDILAFVDAKAKAEENPEKIILNIPLSSLNYERYEEYREKQNGITEKKPILFSIKIDKNDRLVCKKMIDRLRLEGTKTVVSGFYDKNDKTKLTRFAEIIFQAILTNLITAESDIEEIQREVAKYDWQLSRDMNPKNIRATCSAEIIVVETENDSKQEILNFNQLKQRIAEIKSGNNKTK